MPELCGCCQQEAKGRLPFMRHGVPFCSLECVAEYERDHDDDVVPERPDA